MVAMFFIHTCVIICALAVGGVHGQTHNLSIQMTNATSAQPTNASMEFRMSETEYARHDWSHNDDILRQASADSKHEYGNVTSCPTDVIEGAYEPLHKRSTCPWYYEVDHVSTRYPATILQARSSCTCCTGTPELFCEPVTRSMAVLERQESVNSTVTFLEAEVEVTVGYVCAGSGNSNTGHVCREPLYA